VDRRSRVVLETAAGRVVLVDSMLFARSDNRNDVMCAGSHGGRVNMARALEIRPRGALFSDGLDAADVAVATVEAMRARTATRPARGPTG